MTNHNKAAGHSWSVNQSRHHDTLAGYIRCQLSVVTLLAARVQTLWEIPAVDFDDEDIEVATQCAYSENSMIKKR